MRLVKTLPLLLSLSAALGSASALALPNDRDQPIRIQADNAHLDDKQGVATYTGDVIITQDLMRYEIEGEDAGGKIIGRHMSTGIGKPHFWDRARYYNEDRRLAAALDAMEQKSKGI